MNTVNATLFVYYPLFNVFLLLRRVSVQFSKDNIRMNLGEIGWGDVN
jgi:hypothetical protein